MSVSWTIDEFLEAEVICDSFELFFIDISTFFGCFKNIRCFLYSL